MNWIVKLLKFISILGIIFSFIVTGFLISFVVRNKWRAKKYQSKAISFYSSFTLKVLGVKTETLGFEEFRTDNYLVVCNHLSYIDILIFSKHIPSCFITSKEVREMPFIGKVTDNAGCLYVERRNRTNRSKELLEITNALNNGLNIGIFPEATSTDGSSVLRFRKPLYAAAVESHRQVLPICLNYLSIDGEVLSSENRDTICWYGDMEFFPHFWQLCGSSNIVAQLKVFQPINSVAQDIADLANTSHKIVEENFKAFR